MADVSLVNVIKRFGKSEVLHGIDLDIRDGELIVFVGPSGCGKSTLLRIIAGLEEPTEGEIRIDGRPVNHISPKDRDIAMVFQNYALYPHMTVFDNMSFGLKLARKSKAEIKTRVIEAARILNIEPYLYRKPAQLSGGQRQRVAMGRAIIRNPAIFLFDEPLSNLDAKLRTQMRIEIKQLHDRLKSTIVYVTHDQVEAMTLGDRIVVLKDGEIIQVGDPVQLYQNPTNTFVAGFIGNPSMNLLAARVAGSRDSAGFQFEGGLIIPFPRRYATVLSDGQEVIVGMRPEALIPGGQAETGSAWKTEAVVEFIEPMGSYMFLHVDIKGVKALAQWESNLKVTVGDRIEMGLHPDRLHVFHQSSGKVVDPEPVHRFRENE